MTKSISWWDHDRDDHMSCPGCGWTGTGGTDLEEQFPELLEVRCPDCDRLLLMVVFPTLQETRAAAAAGNERALAELPEHEAQHADAVRRRALLLKSPDELPELEGDSLIIIWDIIDQDDEVAQWQVLVHDGTIIWREPAYYESYRRFEQVFAILLERYGTRFRELRPTHSASWWLYGDRLGSVQVVDSLNGSLQREEIPVDTTDRHGPHGLGSDPRFQKAWEFVIEHQGEQDRKTNDSTVVPYTTHLKGVAWRVQTDQGNAEEIIAGLLHDIVEDTPVNGGHNVELTEIEEVFGDRVAEIVGFCTDTDPGPRTAKKAWRTRKEAHFAHIAGADAGALKVIAADKVDNIAGQVRSLEECRGNADAFAAFLEPFKGGFAGTLWYYRGMYAAMGDQIAGSSLYKELTRLIERFASLRAPGGGELARRHRVLNVLNASNPAAVSIERLADGFYGIDADELARLASVPGERSIAETVADHVRKWYCPTHASHPGAKESGGSVSDGGGSASDCTATGWTEEVVDRLVRELR